MSENGDGYLSVAYGNAALVACIQLAKRVIDGQITHDDATRQIKAWNAHLYAIRQAALVDYQRRTLVPPPVMTMRDRIIALNQQNSRLL